MSFTIEIQLPKELPTRRLRSLERLLSTPEKLHKAAASGVLPLVQGSFRRMAASNKNKFGVRGGFWNRMVSGTRTEATADSAKILMPREVGLRYHGGTITPKAAKYLTIPLRAEAYGKSPRQFKDIKFARIGGKLFAFTTDLTEASTRRPTGARKLRGASSNAVGRRRITLLYLLASKATIAGDKNVLPTDEAILQGAARGVQTLINVTVNRGAQG